MLATNDMRRTSYPVIFLSENPDIIAIYRRQANYFFVFFFYFFRSIMGKLETNALYSILDEIVFKISASEESSIGR